MNLEIAENYYDWKEIYPELQILLDNIDVIKAESEKIPQWVCVSFLFLHLSMYLLEFNPKILRYHGRRTFTM